MIYTRQIAQRFLAGFILCFIAACSDAGNGVIHAPDSASIRPSTINLEVFKSPTCGCCGLWIEHLKDNSFQTVVHNKDNLSELKSDKGISPRYQSCHTAISSDGYVFEGHVPAKYIRQFLEEKPAGGIGLSVPGMPVGTPGMEAGDRFSPYNILVLKADGSVAVYAQINTAQEQY